jgi:hypothetical protein
VGRTTVRKCGQVRSPGAVKQEDEGSTIQGGTKNEPDWAKPFLWWRKCWGEFVHYKRLHQAHRSHLSTLAEPDHGVMRGMKTEIKDMNCPVTLPGNPMRQGRRQLGVHEKVHAGCSTA